jgi:hypothetical protein
MQKKTEKTFKTKKTENIIGKYSKELKVCAILLLCL